MTACGGATKAMIAATAAIIVLFAGALPAGATVVLGLSQSSGLADGQSVTVTVSGLQVTVPPATPGSFHLAECGNALADGTPLVTPPDPGQMNFDSINCEELAVVAVSSATMSVPVTVSQSGIGRGQRACFSTAPTPCFVYINTSANEFGEHPVHDVTFAADPSGLAPTPTSTTVTVNGSPLAVSKAAIARIVVSAGTNAVPEGSVRVSLDGAPSTTTAVDQNGSVSVQVADPGTLTDGSSHTVAAEYLGDGSFASSSATTGLTMVGDLNVSIGNGTIVAGAPGTGLRKMVLSVVLSRTPASTVVVNYSTVDGTATAPGDYTAVSGRLTFTPPSTVHYIVVRVGPTASLSPKTFGAHLSAPPGGLAAGFEFRDADGVASVVGAPASATPSVNLAPTATPEGDGGRSPTLQIPLTLSAPAASDFYAWIIVGNGTALRGKVTTGGDWGGPVLRKVRVPKGQTSRFVAIAIYPNLRDSPDLTVNVSFAGLCTNSRGTTCIAIGAASTGTSAVVGTILSDE